MRLAPYRLKFYVPSGYTDIIILVEGYIQTGHAWLADVFLHAVFWDAGFVTLETAGVAGCNENQQRDMIYWR